MAMLDQEPTPPARYGIERVVYRGRYGIKTGSYTAPQPHPRAQLKVPARGGSARRREIDFIVCVPTVGSKSYGRADKLIDLVLSSSIDGTVKVFTESFVLSLELARFSRGPRL